MKYTSILFILILMACSNNKTAQKETSVVQNKRLIEFQFNRGLSDYIGENIGITGFIWTDSIGDFLPRHHYIVYERPNCFECGEVLVEAKTDITVVKIEDTSYVNPFKGYTWKLVKISGVADNEIQLTIDRTEISEYSYPDYENSGFAPITSDYLKYHAKDKDKVYIDAYINPKAQGESEDIFLFKLEKTNVDMAGWAIVHNGYSPNMAAYIEDPKTSVLIEIKDMYEKVVGNKKVRLYGILDFDKTQSDHFTIQAEAIKILK
jgi:hypothetical protein